MSNETFWPSFRLRRHAASTAVACTNTSLPPPSGAMKPKPLEVLKNLTVPIVMEVSCKDFRAAKCSVERGLTTVAGKEVQPSSRRAHKAGRNGALLCDGT